MAVSQTTWWRLISGTLGVICLLLMVTLGMLLKSLPNEIDIKPTSSSLLNKELQEGSDCCSCPQKWVGYRCNCYFISLEMKTWNESRNFCVSQNSSLLQLQNRDELASFHALQYKVLLDWTLLQYRTWSLAVGEWLCSFPESIFII
ncbi:natural killer cells antigen CD94-like isoform X3 [Microcebus murinus]|uniref:natural killer cells antigen CD94-like isoform X3 n=1 Tax=Microcebus murinus TaxID=30608 RepID=UPI003F6B9D9C